MNRDIPNAPVTTANSMIVISSVGGNRNTVMSSNASSKFMGDEDDDYRISNKNQNDNGNLMVGG